MKKKKLIVFDNHKIPRKHRKFRDNLVFRGAITGFEYASSNKYSKSGRMHVTYNIEFEKDFYLYGTIYLHPSEYTIKETIMFPLKPGEAVKD